MSKHSTKADATDVSIQAAGDLNAPEAQVMDYIEGAVEGTIEGVTTDRPPTDPQNLANYEKSRGLTGDAATAFENEVKQDLG